MAISLDDLVEIVDNQTYLEQQVLNVYYYQCTALGTSPENALEELAASFSDVVLSDVTLVQNTGLLHVNRTIKNLSNGVDFFVDTEVIPGQETGAGTGWLPSYVSLGFQLLRSNLFTRNGYKRFSGLSEGNVSGNTWVGSPTNIAEIEEVLGMTFTTLGNHTFRPVIVKRPIPAPGEADPLINPISAAQFRGVGTQNTRKPGRGI